MHSKSPVPRLIYKDIHPISAYSFRMQTPELSLPIYSKFSNQLLNSLPPSKVSTVFSYSSLLNSQNESPRLQELANKKHIVTYKTQSKIHERSKETISIKKIKFSMGEIQKRKSSNAARPKRIVKTFKKPESTSEKFQVICEKANLVRSAKHSRKVIKK